MRPSVARPRPTPLWALPASFLSRVCQPVLSDSALCGSAPLSVALSPATRSPLVVVMGGGPLEVPPPLTPLLPLPQSTGSSRWQCGAAARVSRARMTAAWTFTEFWPSSSCSNAPRTAATPNSTSRRERSTPQVGGGGALGSGGGATRRQAGLGRGRPRGAGRQGRSYGEVGGACVGAGLGAEPRVRPGLWADLCFLNLLDRFPPTCSPRRQ